MANWKFGRFIRLFGALLIFNFSVAEPDAAQFKIGNHTLTVPDGFEVELVAQSPLVDRPVSGSFDEQGRLYLTDVSGSNEKPDKQLEAKPHRLVRLEDTDGDGKFDKTVVFAERMMFPEGCLWHDGSVYVSAPPSIWKLTDTNNDGIADVREEWHQGKTLTGCANDLHGPYLGLDGWIYWCKGAFAEQSYDLENGKKFVTRAAHIFRARENHSGLEPVLTGGMDNPVGVAFTPDGERILCGTFFAPGEPGHRDGLIHAIYGGVYGKVNSVTDSHKKTGGLMPVMTHMGAAAPCSVIRYESAALGNEYRDNLFCCSFNLRKVSRHILVPDGATFKTQDSDFLTSDNPDFHPTDVIEDADGSLIVINTGGWYKICCPTSQLSKPDVLGAVYRIRRKGAPRMADPRGLKLNWAKASLKELASRLGDERPAVRHRAVGEIGKRGAKAVPALRADQAKSNPPTLRREAVWALTRIVGPAAREAVRSALKDEDASVRSAALHSISLWRDANAAKDVAHILESPDPQARRIAAEALGRMGIKPAVQPLLQAAATPGDRVLEHSIIYALIEINEPPPVREALHDASVSAKKVALIALDQMDDGKLEAAEIVPSLRSNDAGLRQAALWVAGHHPDWGNALAGYYRERLEAPVASERGELAQQLSQFASAEGIQSLLAETVRNANTNVEAKRVSLEAMTGAPAGAIPKSWVSAVASALSSENEALLHDAIGTAHALASAKKSSAALSDSLLQIARNRAHPADLRVEALAAMPGGRAVDPDVFSFLQANVSPDQPVTVRNSAVGVLSRAKLTESQLLGLADTMREAGPLEMTKLLSAFERSTNEAVGLKLLSALKDAKGLSSLRADLLKNTVAKYPEPVRQQAQELAATLNADAAKEGAHIEELLTQLKGGDVRRGQAVFNSPKAACSSCHTMGYLGGKVGPDLTSIGQARTERDLLESIIYPSASFVRSFEPYVIQTKSDETYSGVVKKDAPDEVVLATGPGTEVRIARADITDMRPGTVSVMPGGLEQQLSKQELSDLLAFMKSTKWGAQ